MATASTATDFYALLEVPRNASAEQLKKAYRRLARKYHPDVNQNQKENGERFAQINAAYEVLKDPEKRRAYDRYGQHWQEFLAAEKEGRFSGGEQRAQPGRSSSQPGFGGFDFGEMESIFGRRQSGFDSVFGQIDIRGADISGELEISLDEAYSGAVRTVTLDSSNGAVTLEVKIPAGIDNGKVLRLRGQGGAGIGQGPRGDVLLTIKIRPHPLYSRHGHNLQVRAEVPLQDAIFGGRLRVTQLAGKGSLEVAIPPHTQDGGKLRLSGKGMPIPGKSGAHGDLIVEVHVNVPQSDTELRELGRRLIDA